MIRVWLVLGLLSALCTLMMFTGATFRWTASTVERFVTFWIAAAALCGVIGFPLMFEHPLAGLLLGFLSVVPLAILAVVAAVFGGFQASTLLGGLGMLQGIAAWRLHRLARPYRSPPEAGARSTRARSQASTLKLGS